MKYFINVNIAFMCKIKSELESSKRLNNSNSKIIKELSLFIDNSIIVNYLDKYNEEAFNIVFEKQEKIKRYTNIKDTLIYNQTNKEHIIGMLYIFNHLLTYLPNIQKNIFNFEDIYLMIVLHNIGIDIENHMLRKNNYPHSEEKANSRIDKLKDLKINKEKISELKKISNLFKNQNYNKKNIEIRITRIIHYLEELYFLTYNTKDINFDILEFKINKIKEINEYNKKNFNINILEGIEQQIFGNKTKDELIYNLSKTGLENVNLFNKKK